MTHRVGLFLGKMIAGSVVTTSLCLAWGIRAVSLQLPPWLSCPLWLASSCVRLQLPPPPIGLVGGLVQCATFSAQSLSPLGMMAVGMGAPSPAPWEDRPES